MPHAGIRHTCNTSPSTTSQQIMLFTTSKVCNRSSIWCCHHLFLLCHVDELCLIALPTNFRQTRTVVKNFYTAPPGDHILITELAMPSHYSQ